MDWAAIIAKIVGVILLGVTLRSVYRHVRDQVRRHRAAQSEGQSVAETVLNNVLLYAWLLFMLTFSTGMIVNN
ncbi:MAG: hypothetical protein GF331_08700 [Chitinivibrionales bacterium]|nr:hypothetical protein [Chitinivibrionales bacterium]